MLSICIELDARLPEAIHRQRGCVGFVGDHPEDSEDVGAADNQVLFTVTEKIGVQ
jgi:hypothetical protein